MEAWREEYRRMAKPRAIEEVGDTYLIRPLGFLLVQLFRRTPITPTAVSFLSVLPAWWTAWLYYLSNRVGGDAALAVLAAFTFLLHSALDSADGQLARVTGRISALGRIVDGFCDSLSFLSIYAAIVLSAWYRSTDYQLTMAVLAAAAAYTHSLQSSLTEYQRTLYLLCVHGKQDIIESDPRSIERVSRSEGGVFPRLLHIMHTQYYRQQRLFLASTSRLESFVLRWLQDHPGRTMELAPVYERLQRPTMRGWALLAPNSHKLAIIFSAFLPVYEGSFWGGLGMGWYLVYDLALNVVMALLVHRQANVNDRTLQDIRRLGQEL